MPYGPCAVIDVGLWTCYGPCAVIDVGLWTCYGPCAVNDVGLWTCYSPCAVIDVGLWTCYGPCAVIDVGLWTCYGPCAVIDVGLGNMGSLWSHSQGQGDDACCNQPAITTGLGHSQSFRQSTRSSPITSGGWGKPPRVYPQGKMLSSAVRRRHASQVSRKDHRVVYSTVTGLGHCVLEGPQSGVQHGDWAWPLCSQHTATPVISVFCYLPC
ncbi:hypothetical protein ACOMHN_002473 [Nucella lapillus]